MKEQTLPMMPGSTLYVTSDYAGNQRASAYEVLSILIVDPDHSPEWPMQRSLVRTGYLPNGRRMAFKALNDRMRREALMPFLHVAGLLHGICATVAISKRIRGLVTSRRTLSDVRQTGQLRGKWDVVQFERMARITQFTSLFVAGLARPDQQVIWISDQDDIFANEERKHDTGLLFTKCMDAHFPHSLPPIMIGTTEIDPGDRGEEDLAAIPDLVAGAVAELVTASSRANHPDVLPPVSPKATAIVEWLFRLPKHLHTLVVVIELNQEGKFVLFPLDLL